MFCSKADTLRTFHVIEGQNARYQISSDRRCKRKAHDACPIETWRLGFRAPLFARKKFNHFITSHWPKKKNSQASDRVLMGTHAIYLSDDPSAHIFTKHTKNYVFHFIRWKRSTQTEKETIHERYFLVTRTRGETSIIGMLLGHFRVKKLSR